MPFPSPFQVHATIFDQDYIMRDHRIHGVGIMPGVTFVDMIYRVCIAKGLAPETVELRHIVFKEPVSSTAEYDKRIQLDFQQKGGDWTISGRSQKVKDDHVLSPTWDENFSCEIAIVHDELPAPLDITTLREHTNRSFDIDVGYGSARELGIVHGTFIKGLGQVHESSQALLADVRLSDLATGFLDDFHIHPSFLDCATLMPCLFQEEGFFEGNPFIPLVIEKFRAYSALGSACLIHSSKEKNTVSSKDLLAGTMTLYHPDGRPAVHFERLNMKRIRSQGLIHKLTDVDGAPPKATPEIQPIARTAQPQQTASVPKEAPLEGAAGFEQIVQTLVAKLLDMPVDQLDPEAGFYDHGLESTDLLGLVRDLEVMLGEKLYPTLLFEYPTIGELATYLGETYGSPPTDATPEPSFQDAPTECVMAVETWQTEEAQSSPNSLKNPLWIDLGLALGQTDQTSWLQLKQGSQLKRRDTRSWQGDLTRRETYQDLFQQLAQSSQLPQQIVLAFGPTPQASPSAQAKTTTQQFLAVIALAQAWLGRPGTMKLEILLAMPPEDPMTAAMLAAARTLGRESPRLHLKTFSWSKQETPDSVAQILAEVTQPATNGAAIRWMNGERQQKVMQAYHAPAQTFRLRRGGTYLISGGSGGIGMILARHLSSQYQAGLVLLGRSPKSARHENQIKELEALGGHAMYLRADLGNPAGLTKTLAQIEPSFGSLQGVFHAAGVLQDGLVTNKTKDEVLTVLQPKLKGTLNLDEATATQPLDFFAMFGSVAGVVGNPGQIDYAFANGFLGDFSQQRQKRVRQGKRSGHSLCLDWPFWESGGMTLDESSKAAMFAASGVRPISNHLALQALESLLSASVPRAMVVAGAKDKMIATFDLKPAAPNPAHKITPPSPQTVIPEERASRSLAEEKIAIVGMAGKYPMAPDLFAFWENLKQGRDCISEIPADRWDHSKYFDPQRHQQGKTYAKWGGFVNGHDQFDPMFFKITPAAAEAMDPQERLFLQTAWHTFEDAGYDRERLSQETMGVFAGVMWAHYQLYGAEEAMKQNFVATASSHASVANHVSFVFDLKGPSMALDTMCSSSLTALHLACQSLQKGECSAALAGGVNLSIHPSKYTYLAQYQMASSDGRCRSFGEGGDGYVPGEGVGAVLLKPLSRALADGDRIYGLVRGSVLNHGGKTSGYTVPDPRAQGKLIAKALEVTATDPAELSYIETHGTGTSLGDPIEIKGLQRALAQHGLPSGSLPIGSVKSNIGHLESAAGIAAIAKVVLQMKHQQLVPSLHADPENPHIDFAATPLVVNKQLTPLRSRQTQGEPQPHVAGISSFGAGGANAHVILESWPQAQPTPDVAGECHLFLLSASDEERLQAYAQDLSQWLSGAGGDVSLNDLCFTYQQGREAMAARLAVVVSHKQALEQALNAFAAGARDTCYLGYQRKKQRGRKESTLQTPLTQVALGTLAQQWVAGKNFDWQGLQATYPNKGHLISTPPYPFAPEKYWVPIVEKPLAVTPQLHPLISRNTSTLRAQQFVCNLRGNMQVLADHRLQGRRILPAVAVLEIMRAAGTLAEETPVTRISNLVWQKAIALDDRDDAEFLINLNLQPKAHGTTARMILDDPDDAFSSGDIFTEPHGQIPDKLAIDLLKGSMPQRLSGRIFYQRLAETGFNYGPSFQTLDDVVFGVAQALAFLKSDAVDDQMALPPGLLDGGIQAIAALLSQTNQAKQQTFVPFSLNEACFYKPLGNEAIAHVQLQEQHDTWVTLDVTLADHQGQIHLTLKGLMLKQWVATTPAEMLYFNPVWEPGPALQPWSSHEDTLWVFAPDEDWQKRASATLSASLLEKTRWVLPGESFRQVANQVWQLNPQMPDAWLELFADKTGLHVLFAWSFTPNTNATSAIDRDATSVFNLAQAWLKQDAQRPLNFLVLANHGAEQTPFTEGLSGFFQSLHQEQPRAFGRVLNMDSDPTKQMAALLGELVKPTALGVRQKLQQNQRWLQKLQPAEPVANAGLPCPQRGVVIITGGVGGLGRLFAKDLVQQFGARLALVGRSPESEATTQFLGELNKLGGQALYFSADLHKREEVRSMLQEVRKQFGPVQGIVHSAGTKQDSFFIQKPMAAFNQVLAAKVVGFTHLDAETRQDPLAFFAAFSSSAGIMGNVGQTDYAYANACLDAFVAQRETRRQQGQVQGVTRTINWPLWQQGGMGVDEASLGRMKNLLGLMPLPTQAGLNALPQAFAGSHAQWVVFYGDSKRLTARLEQENKPKTAKNTAPGDASQVDAALAMLKDDLVAVSKLPAKKLHPDEPLENYGIDSVMIMQLNARLEERFGELSKTLFFEYQTLGELADYFAANHREQLLATPSANQASDSRNPPNLKPSSRQFSGTRFKDSQPQSKPENQPIAVVGLAGRYPEAPDLEIFWENLVAGKDCIREIPLERWDYRDNFNPDGKATGEVYAKWGGFLEGIDQFDPLFFNISPREARFLDPQERLWLETVWQVVEDAGHTRQSLNRDKVGMFVGVMWNQYPLFGAEQTLLGNPMAPSGSFASIANRASYWFGFRGPSIALDTMCSGSLTALHLACKALRDDECRTAIAGGVNLSIHPQKYVQLSHGRFAATDGRCRSFGKGGDGYVPGEGVGAVMLKTLAQAHADGDQIYGLIRATGLNHGGKTNGYTVPNPVAQGNLIAEVLEKAGVAQDQLSYIEAHGTGTSLGDPIEVTGLMRALKQRSDQAGDLAMGSVKSNIGHLESAAGIAGLSKVLLQMKHKTLVPSLHAETLNPNIAFGKTPLRVQRDCAAWDTQNDAQGQPLPRVAGLSSFGAGGANAHVIVEEGPVHQEPDSAVKAGLLVLSAQSDEALRARANQLHAFLSARWSSQGASPGLSLEDLQQMAADQLNLPALKLDVQTHFEDLGMDATEHMRFLQAVSEKSLDHSASSLFGAQTLDELWQRLQGNQPPLAQADLKLNQVLFTLQVGREHMTHRFAQRVQSPEQTLQALKSLAESSTGQAGLLGECETPHLGDRFEIGNAGEVDWEQVGKAYVAGCRIAFEKGYDQPEKRVSLPTYPFERQRCWLPLQSKAESQVAPAPLHPLVHQNTATLYEFSFKTHLQSQAFYLRDHIIGGQAILPGVAYLEMARAAGQLATQEPVKGLGDILWASPIVVPPQGKDVTIALLNKGSNIIFEVFSRNATNRQIHAQGTLLINGNAPQWDASERIDLEAIRKRCEQTLSADFLYNLFAEIGYAYGPSFQVTQALHCGPQEALAELKLPAAASADAEAFTLHPSLMDGALRAVLGIGAGENQDRVLRLPFSLGTLEIRQPLPQRVFAHAQPTSEKSANGIKRYSIHIVDASGQILALIHNFAAREVPKKAKETSQETLCFIPVWRERALAGEQLDLNQHQQAVVLVMANPTLAQGLAQNLPGNTLPIRIHKATAFKKLAEDLFELRPDSKEDFANLLAALIASGKHPTHLLHAWHWQSLDIPSGAEPSEQVLETMLTTGAHSLRCWLAACRQAKYETRMRCVYLYQGEASASHPTQESLGGFAKSLPSVFPRFELAIVQTEKHTTPARLLEIALAELQAPGRMNGRELCWIGEKRYLRELEALQESAETQKPAKLKKNGVYVITGGSGGIGKSLAMRLATHYSARMVLSGRSPEDAAKRSFLEKLTGAGGQAAYVAADVTCPQQTKALMETTRHRFGRIDGVFHAAGLTGKVAVTEANQANFETALRPKMQGTINLDQATREDAPELFVLFSSISAFLGDFGACNYAMGNRFLDSFAAWRGDRERKAGNQSQSLSINWPLWAEGKMDLPPAEAELFRKHTGMALLPTDLGLNLLEKALQQNTPQLVATYGQAAKINRALGMQQPITTSQPHTEPAAPPLAVSQANDQSIDPLLVRALEGYLKNLLSKATDIPPKRIQAKVELETYGIDSVMIMELNQALEEAFPNLPRTLFFEQRTIADLAHYLAVNRQDGARAALDLAPLPPGNSHEKSVDMKNFQSEIVGVLPSQKAAQAPAVAPVAPRVPLQTQARDVAIVGLAGRYPKSPDLKAFWENLAHGKDCIEEIPSERWPLDAFYHPKRNVDGKTYSKWGGFIEGAEAFDPLFFNISPKEAELMDPQERLFLEIAWQTFEDAGYAKSQLSGSPVGVFVGVMWAHYQLFGAENVLNGTGLAGNSSYASIANRVSYWFNLSGPSMAVDTMCSSSLTAIHLAYRAIVNGDCDMALAGGVNLSTHPNKYIQLSMMNMVSSDGRCRSFGEGGDGYVPGEGLGAVLLKPLDQALADGDQVYGVLKASAMNHGGKTNGYTVPNPKAQGAVITKALQRAGVDAQSISYIEAHGTGTPLGDPIEMAGLEFAFRPQGLGTQSCAIGSVKANIGHCEGAAGISAMTKVLLQMKHRAVAPAIHTQAKNPNIDFENASFRLEKTATPWKPTQAQAKTYPRRAGISSFGAGGANVHLIVEAFEPQRRTPKPMGHDQLFVLSAQTPQQLKTTAASLHRFLQARLVKQQGFSELAQTFRQAMARVVQTDIVNPVALDTLDLSETQLQDLASQISKTFATDLDSETLVALNHEDAILAWLSEGPLGSADEVALHLEDVAFTLQTGREAMAERLAIVAQSPDELLASLAAFGEDQPDVRASYGNAKQAVEAVGGLLEVFSGPGGATFMETMVQRGEWDKIAELWVAGVTIPWQGLYAGNELPKRMSLPGYPFRRKVYSHPEAAKLRAGQTTQKTSSAVDLPTPQPSMVQVIVPAADVTPKASPSQQEAPASVEDGMIHMLRHAIAEFLHLDPAEMDPHAELAEYGFDSFIGTKLLNGINERLNLSLPFDVIFEYNSLHRLGHFLASQVDADTLETVAEEGTSAPKAALPPASPIAQQETQTAVPEKQPVLAVNTPNVVIEPQGKKPELPDLAPFTASEDALRIGLSAGQQGLWYIYQSNRESHAYNTPLLFNLGTKLQTNVLRKALDLLVMRHDSLRATFHEEDGTPFSQIHSQLPDYYFEQDLRHLDWDACLAHWDAIYRQPIDLGKGPLFKVGLFQIPGDGWALMILVQHIVSDGTSLVRFTMELAQVYAQLAGGLAADLPAKKAEYRDFVAWQIEMLASDQASKDWEYWRHQLNGELPVLSLPLDRPRPVVPSYRGDAYRFQVKAETMQALRTLAKKEKVTLYTVLLATYKVLLQRYSHQDDLIVGTAISGRYQSKLEAVVGVMVNMIGLRSDLTGNPSFQELLAQLKQTIRSGMTHGRFPFPRLVNKLRILPEKGLSPIFQTVFTLQNSFQSDVLEQIREKNQLQPGGYLDLESIEGVYEAGEFDLAVEVTEYRGEGLGLITFNTDIFDRERIAVFAKHFVYLLDAIVANPSLPIHHYELESQAASEQTIAEFGEVITPYPSDQSLVSMFESQVERQPPAAAYVLPKASMGLGLLQGPEISYQTLNDQANRLARMLRERGIGQEATVGLLLPRSPELIMAMLAVLKASAAYVALDPDHPADRLAHLTQDAQLQAIVTCQHLSARVPEHKGFTLSLEEVWSKLASLENTNLGIPIAATQMANITYTSGSTGKPKGIMILHGAIIRLFHHTNYVKLGPGDRMGQAASPIFDAATLEIWGPLTTGATMVGLTREVSLDSQALQETIEAQRINVLFLTTALLNQHAQAAPELFTKLDYAMFGGEAVSVHWVRHILASGGPKHLVHLYGPAESTTLTTWYPIKAVSDVAASIPIGTPVANTSAYVLDKQLRPVPQGVPGELFSGGDGMARGYYGKPALTAMRFIPNPHATHPGARMYMTGDLVRYDNAGAITFIGREDNQIKIRGFRIEIDEIQAVMRSFTPLKDALITVREDQPGTKQLVAYAIKDPEVEIEAEAEPEKLEDAQVAQWQELYDMAYDHSRVDEVFYNFTGWDSSYTGKDIPSIEMREWVDGAIQGILDPKPKAIYEIGCGTGLLTFQLVPKVKQYQGLDFSKQAIAYVQRNLPQLGRHGKKATVRQGLADDFSAMQPRSVDAVVLNSIIQYFPHLEYLFRVFAGASKVIRNGGTLYAGDIRSQRALKAFQTSVGLYQSSDAQTCEQLKQRIATDVAMEEELTIDFDFFYSLPHLLQRVSHVEIFPKRGRFHNELTKYRYEARLHIAAPLKALNVAWLAYAGQNLAQLGTEIALLKPGTYRAYHALPNARNVYETEAMGILDETPLPDNVAALKTMLKEKAPFGFEPEDLWAFADEHQVQVKLLLAAKGEDHALDVVFYRPLKKEQGFAGCHVLQLGVLPKSEADFEHLANDPLAKQKAGRFVPALLNFLQDKLPNYMVPTVLKVDAYPLTASGKVDYRALPAPDMLRSRREFIPPTTATELALAEIWSEILNEDRIGIRDNFFELGGHSLLSMRLMTRIQEVLGTDLPLSILLEDGTIAGLAGLIDGQDSEGPRSTLVGLKRKGNLPPLFLVHPGGGEVMCFHELANHLDKERPLYAWQAPGLNGREPAIADIHAAAERYIQDLKAIQPQGPYHIGGYSSGCVLAAEIVGQLEAAGDRVTSLSLIDGYATVADIKWDEARNTIVFSKLIGNRADMDFRLEKKYRRLKRMSQTEQYTFVMELFQKARLQGPGFEKALLAREYDVLRANSQACSRYQLQPVIAPTVLLRTAPNMDKRMGKHGWNKKGFVYQEVVVPGHHFSMIAKPHVSELAHKLNQELCKRDPATHA